MKVSKKQQREWHEDKDSEWTETEEYEKSFSFYWKENAAKVAKINE